MPSAPISRSLQTSGESSSAQLTQGVRLIRTGCRIMGMQQCNSIRLFIYFLKDTDTFRKVLVIKHMTKASSTTQTA